MTPREPDWLVLVRCDRSHERSQPAVAQVEAEPLPEQRGVRTKALSRDTAMGRQPLCQFLPGDLRTLADVAKDTLVRPMPLGDGVGQFEQPRQWCQLEELVCAGNLLHLVA